MIAATQRDGHASILLAGTSPHWSSLRRIHGLPTGFRVETWRSWRPRVLWRRSHPGIPDRSASQQGGPCQGSAIADLCLGKTVTSGDGNLNVATSANHHPVVKIGAV